MSSSEQSETFGTLTVQFRDGRKDNIPDVAHKDASTLLDHLGRMFIAQAQTPIFAAIRRPNGSYAVDLTQVRSVTFAPEVEVRDGVDCGGGWE